MKLVQDVPYTGPRHIDAVGAVLSVVGLLGLLNAFRMVRIPEPVPSSSGAGAVLV